MNLTDVSNLILGDCLEKMRDIPDGSVDAIVTDPPYELGFMGKSWDSTGIANSVEMWVECLRVLKPGGYLLSFGGTRTYHRMACAIEDAGFEVRDMIEWIYGSGFPKSLDIGKAIDKSAGVERTVVPRVRVDGKATGRVVTGFGDADAAVRSGPPETEDAKMWDGWGTALKPAHEPICMARKPLAEKTVAENVLKHGTGGININESRVEGEMGADRSLSTPRRTDNTKFGKANETINPQSPLGRFPANLIHDNSEEVRECFPETKTGKAIRSNSGGKTFGGENTKPVMEDLGYEDDGGNASRFFKSIIYQAKASKSERDKGCEELEEKDAGVWDGNSGRSGIRTARDGVTAIQPVKARNNHPTVKPTALMGYLINMVSREGAIILDPFMGSGTTGVACRESKRNFIGIEKDEEYFKIAKERINNAQLPLL